MSYFSVSTVPQKKWLFIGLAGLLGLVIYLLISTQAKTSGSFTASGSVLKDWAMKADACEAKEFRLPNRQTFRGFVFFSADDERQIVEVSDHPDGPHLKVQVYGTDQRAEFSRDTCKQLSIRWSLTGVRSGPEDGPYFPYIDGRLVADCSSPEASFRGEVSFENCQELH